MKFSDLKYLQVPLPDDIQNMKSQGYFDEMIALIDMRLEKSLPKALAKRLEFEKYLVPFYDKYYIYSFEDTFKMFNSKIRDFSRIELKALQQNHDLDWIYKKGEVYFIKSCFDNATKTIPALEQRQIEKVETKNEGEHDSLDIVVNQMKEKGSLTYKIRLKHSIKIKKENERVGEIIRVHLPLPTKAQQVRDLNIIEISPTPKHIAAFDYPSRTVFFEEELKSDQVFSAEYEFINHVEYVELDPNKASKEQPKFMTEEKAPHIVFTPYLKELYNEIVGDEENPVKKARLIYNFITTKVKYSYMRRYLTIIQIPEYAASNLKGDCGVQALLFITLCRLGGIPARWQAGMYTPAERIGNHDWAEFYIEPYGWVFADLSFGGSSYRRGKTDRWNFYFGNLDPFRTPLTQEFQCEFDPPKEFMRHDPYDNQNGEVEYFDKGLDVDDFECIREIIEVIQIK